MPPVHRCLRRAATIAAVAAGFAISAAGCSKQAQAPHGSPVLLEVLWEVDGIARLVWSRDADAAVSAVAPGSGSKIDFVFDRRLDGARIEDTIDDKPVPKANPPITVGWPDMTTVMSDPPFAADVFYNSVPQWGPGTTSVFLRLQIAGFPSATPVRFSLDANGLTSIYGEPMDGPPEITVNTEPLTVTLPSSAAMVSTSYMAPIAFSTRAPGADAIVPFIRVTSGGAALSFAATAASDRKRIYLVPVGCRGGWPPSARVDIAVAAGLPDGFGRPLATAATGSFMTAPIAATPVDGGCGTNDAGAGDAGPDDAGIVDAGSDDAGIVDAGSDDAGDAQAAN